MGKTQKQRIIENNSLPPFTIGDEVYKGMPPHFIEVNGTWVKAVKGVPFIKIESNNNE